MKNGTLDSRIIRYVILTWIVSWALWTPGILHSFGMALGFPGSFAMTLGNFMPSILGVVFIGASRSKADLKDLVKRTFARKPSWGWGLYTVFLMPAILGVSYLVAQMLGGMAFDSVLWPFLQGRLWQIFPMILYFVVFQGPLGEEIGWRGFLLPGLLRRYDPYRASLVVGIIWSVWHLPKFIWVGSTQYALTAAYGLGGAFLGYTVYTVMLSFLMTVLFCGTGRSVIQVMVFHGMANFSHGLITIMTDRLGALSLLVVMGMVCLLIRRFVDERRIALENAGSTM